jgi:hypothetical protein
MGEHRSTGATVGEGWRGCVEEDGYVIGGRWEAERFTREGNGRQVLDSRGTLSKEHELFIPLLNI